MELTGFGNVFIGGGGFVTASRFGELYYSGEAGVGTPGSNLVVRWGWVTGTGGKPTETHLNNLLSGWGATASAQSVGGEPAYGVTYGFTSGTDPDDLALEIGTNLIGGAGWSLTGSRVVIQEYHPEYAWP